MVCHAPLARRGSVVVPFPQIPKPKPYKDGYRARLDALPLTVADHQVVLAEVQDVFGLNGALFAELSRTVLGLD